MSPTSRREVEQRIASVPHWHQVIHFGDGVSTPGAYDPAPLLERIGLAELAGKRVLDVGTRDGYFAFACEALGAEVLAIDHADLEVTGFGVARDLLGSKVEYVQANVYDISPERFGHFDVVLFLGVLYHLRHPLLALDGLRSVCRAELVVESLTATRASSRTTRSSGRCESWRPDWPGFRSRSSFRPGASTRTPRTSGSRTRRRSRR